MKIKGRVIRRRHSKPRQHGALMLHTRYGDFNIRGSNYYKLVNKEVVCNGKIAGNILITNDLKEDKNKFFKILFLHIIILASFSLFALALMAIGQR